MKKLSLLLVFVLFLASCFGGKDSQKTSTETSSWVSQIASSPEVGQKIAQDPGYMQCIRSAEYSCGVNFINSYAINNSDEQICEQFGDQSLRMACKDLVVTETAKKTLDETRCDALSDEKKALCVQSVITSKWVKKLDPTVCSNYIAAPSDVDSLENLKDRCVVHVIDQLPPTEKTKGFCGLIINKEVQKSCEEKIQMYIDVSKKPA